MSLPQHDDTQSHTELVTDVLARVHAELEEIAQRIDHNQAMIAKSTWETGSVDSDYVKAMQDADRSAQRIAGVACFLRAISNAARPDWRIDTAIATDTLTLTELIRSIGMAGHNAQTKAHNSVGEVDFF